jgi:hypothetical protein
MCEMCGCGSQEFMGVPLKSFSDKDMSAQGQSGTTNTMVNSIESMREFGAGK